MITRERIEALRADHHRTGPGRVLREELCDGCGLPWPCDTYAALTLALEAETLRAALEASQERLEQAENLCERQPLCSAVYVARSKWVDVDAIPFDGTDAPFEPECWGVGSLEHETNVCRHFEEKR